MFGLFRKKITIDEHCSNYGGYLVDWRLMYQVEDQRVWIIERCFIPGLWFVHRSKYYTTKADAEYFKADLDAMPIGGTRLREVVLVSEKRPYGWQYGLMPPEMVWDRHGKRQAWVNNGLAEYRAKGYPLPYPKDHRVLGPPLLPRRETNR